MKIRTILLLALLCAPAAMAGLLGPNGGDVEEKKANIRKLRDEMLAEVYSCKPELMALSAKRLELTRDFFTRQDAGKLTDEASTDIADRWLKTVQSRLDLWEKYQKKIGETVSPTRAPQFRQLENQIALFIDIAIASEMPAITPPSSK